MEIESGAPAPLENIRLDVIQGERDLAQLLALLNTGFKVPAGASFYDDFPVWDPRHGAAVFRIGAYEGTKLVSTASARLAELKTPSGPLTAVLIGCVATHDGWRGRGLASRIVPAAVDWARERGAALAILWGSEHSLYQRIGFELCGVQARVPLSTLRIAPPLHGEGEPGRGWTPSLYKCLQNRPGGLALSLADRIWMRAHRNVKWRWLGDARAPRAYAAVGRGIDLPGMVHEWGGEREALLELLVRIEAEMPGLELLGSPFIFNHYRIQYDEAAVEFLGMVQVLEPRRVFGAFRPNARQAMPATGDRLLARQFFGPGTAPGLDPAVFPLPLWIWGLDAC